MVDIGFDVEQGAPVYWLFIDVDGKLWNGTVEVATKKLDGGVSEGAVSGTAKNGIDRFKDLRLSLSEASSTGETYGGGRAVSASLDEFKGRTIFLVVVVSRGHLKQISIDSSKVADRRNIEERGR